MTDATAVDVAAFRQGFGDTGYVDGRNVTVEYHWPEGYCGSGGCAASVGWDACCGLGTPDGRKIAGILGAREI
jgi:hypothetical protein